MGHRLHVAKTYTVEYALPDNFNHEVTEFHDLLNSLDVSYTGESWDDDFDVYKEDWQKPYWINDLCYPIFFASTYRDKNQPATYSHHDLLLTIIN